MLCFVKIWEEFIQVAGFFTILLKPFLVCIYEAVGLLEEIIRIKGGGVKEENGHSLNFRPDNTTLQWYSYLVSFAGPYNSEGLWEIRLTPLHKHVCFPLKKICDSNKDSNILVSPPAWRQRPRFRCLSRFLLLPLALNRALPHMT